MRAKMPQGQKVAEAGEYLCIWCETRFTFQTGELACPECGNTDRNDLVTVYMEDDTQEEEMMSAADWGQGD